MPARPHLDMSPQAGEADPSHDQIHDSSSDAGRAHRLHEETLRLERSLTANPRDVGAILRAAEQCTELGYCAEAAALYTQAMAIEPARAGALGGMARLLCNQGMHDDAVELLRNAIERAPHDATLWHAIGTTMLGRGDAENARRFFDEAVRLQPDLHACRLARAALHQRRGRLAEALADYDILRAAVAQDPGVLVGWGDVKLLMGACDDAKIAYSAALGLVGDRWPVEDRLQRLAIMAFTRALPRRDLPPSATMRLPQPTAEPINIVLFHADIPAGTVSPFEKPDYHAMLAQTIAVARAKTPGARIVLLSDEQTRFAPGLPVDRILRRPVPHTQLMYERMRLEREFLASPDCAGDTVFIDSDVIVNRDPREAFDGTFDVGLTWRLDPPDAPFNGGVALYRNTPAALKFYDHLIATHHELETFPAVVARFPQGMRQWWGHQLAMAATVGWSEFAKRQSDRMSVDGTVVRFLPEETYNFALESASAAAEHADRYFIHFKGARKGGIGAYATQVLGSKEASAAAPAIVTRASLEAEAKDPRRYTYDLGVAPISYDVGWFLAMARNRGIQHVEIVPGPHFGFRDDGWYQKADIAEKHFRLWNIIVPACQLAGMTVTVHRDRARSVPTIYRPEPLFAEGIRENVFRASAHAKRWVADWLGSRGIERPIVVTLRESHWPSRNSNMAAWRRFAEETKAVVIPDTEGHIAFGHVFDGINMDRRLALYEAASVVMGANGGPLALCWLSLSLPYLTFKMTSDYPASTPEAYARRGFPVGSQFRWAGPHQRLVWADDDYDTIRRTYDSFLATTAQATGA